MGKNFKNGMNSLLGGSDDQENPKRGRPKTTPTIVVNTSKAGTKENETRATFLVNDDQLKRVKALAYWERVSIKDVLAEALEKHLSSKGKDVQEALKIYESKA